MALHVQLHSLGDAPVPYTVKVRRERSRELAQRRRTTYKSLMSDLAQELPFSKDVISQVDYNSRLRLALCYFRMKSLMQESPVNGAEDEDLGCEDGNHQEIMEYRKPAVFPPGMFQDLVTEALDGFVLVTLLDGTVVYVSENIHKHLGLFQSEHIGFSMYDIIFEEDQEEVKRSIHAAEANAFARLSDKGTANCTFFCRMKCSRYKVANTVTKSPGYKLVFVSGHFKASGRDPFLVAIVRPVSPPSILEIRMEGNMFVTHYSLDMRCIFFDGRLRPLMGYVKTDLIGHMPFEYHHHDDVEATLECSRGIMTKGEGLSGYYRFMSQSGQFVWIQSRATLMFDSRSGKPSYIVCMNFVISKEAGERDCALRKAIASSASTIHQDSRSLDPFPVPREDSKMVNPLLDPNSSTEDTPQISLLEEEPTSTTSPVGEPKSHSGSISSSLSSSESQSRSQSQSSSVSSYRQVSRQRVPSDPRSSPSPDSCLPDSTSLSSPPPSVVQPAPSVGQFSDHGYYSGSVSMSRTSSGVMSPHVSSGERDTMQGYPGQQFSPDPPSVFSPASILSVASTPTKPTFQAASVQSKANPSTGAVSFPKSIPAPTSYHTHSAFQQPPTYHESKFRPSFQPNFNFGSQPAPFNPPSGPVLTSQMNGHTSLPAYVKQEGSESNCHSCGYSVAPPPGNHFSSFGTESFGFSSSVIVLDDPSPAHFPYNAPEVKNEPELPELTTEDLNILDFMDEGSHQYSYAQTSLRYH